MPSKSYDGKRKIMKEAIIIPVAVAAASTRAIMAKEDAEEAKEFVTEKAATIVSI
jgi:hypothetical protein